MIKEGSSAPDFTAKNTDGETVRLKDLRGRKVVLYFYPKEDTPYSQRGRSFRDRSVTLRSEVSSRGVSTDVRLLKDLPPSQLPFTLLPNGHSISTLVFTARRSLCRTTWCQAMTFLIDERQNQKVLNGSNRKACAEVL